MALILPLEKVFCIKKIIIKFFWDYCLNSRYVSMVRGS